MRIRLLTITHKSKAWIKTGYLEYAQRISTPCKLELVEIPAEKRTAHADLVKIKNREGEKILAAIHPQHHVIALEMAGELWSTEHLTAKMEKWLASGKNIDLLIGGPEGLSSLCLQQAKEKWSLSSLTLPHLLVRVIIAEQIYRALSIIKGHPYHR